MLGVSLPYTMLRGEPPDAVQAALLADFGGLTALYRELLRLGVGSVELRSVKEADEPAALLRTVSELRAAGLRVTIHGGKLPEPAMDDAEAAAFFAPYTALFAASLQNEYNLTVHALSGRPAADSVRALGLLAVYARTRGYPLRLTLENNRQKPPGSPGDSCGGVLDMARAAGDPDLYFCWDFGHYYYNLSRPTRDREDALAAGHDDPPAAGLPSQEFLARVGHTHIHGVSQGHPGDMSRTHFPPTPENLPLTRFCAALEAAAYGGVWNLELDFPRFYGKLPLRAALEDSIQALRRSLAEVSRKTGDTSAAAKGV